MFYKFYSYLFLIILNCIFQSNSNSEVLDVPTVPSSKDVRTQTILAGSELVVTNMELRREIKILKQEKC